MGHGVQDLNAEDFEFVQDAVYHAKGYMGYSRQERRRQTLAFRLRKDRARRRADERKRDQRRREDIPHIPVVAPLTEIQAWIAGMQPPLKPRAVYTKLWRDKMARKWRRVLRADPAMADLLQLVKDGVALGDYPQRELLRDLEVAEDSLDLDDIHPIFSKANMERSFLETELDFMALHKTREHMRPALALATKFLTDPQLGRAFWYHLMYGAPITDMATKKTYLEADPREADEETARSDWLALLDELANRMQFNWQPSRTRSGEADACHAGHGYLGLVVDAAPSMIQYQKRLNRPEVGYNGFIAVAVHFLWHCLSPNSETCYDVESDLSFQLMLAITLAHEISHAVYAMRRLPSIFFQNRHTEVHAYSTDFRNEIGESFEDHLWKGVQIHGYIRHNWPCKLSVRTWKGAVLGQPTIYTKIPEAWLRGLFRKGTWDDFSKQIDALPRPDGETREFRADRFLHGLGLRNVGYVDGVARLNEEDAAELDKRGGNPKVEGDLDTWWNKIREADIAEAARAGHALELHWGPRLEFLGQSLVEATEDGSSSDSSEDAVGADAAEEAMDEDQELEENVEEVLEEPEEEDSDQLEEGANEVPEELEEATAEEPAGDRSVGVVDEYLGQSEDSFEESEEDHQDDAPPFFNDRPMDSMDEDAESLEEDLREDFDEENRAGDEDYPYGGDFHRTESGSEASGDSMAWTKDEDLWDLPLVPEDESIASVTETETSGETGSSDSVSLEGSGVSEDEDIGDTTESEASEETESSDGSYLEESQEEPEAELEEDSDEDSQTEEQNRIQDLEDLAEDSESESEAESEPESESEPEGSSDGSSTGDSTLDEYASDEEEVAFERAQLSPTEDILNPYKYY